MRRGATMVIPLVAGTCDSGGDSDNTLYNGAATTLDGGNFAKTISAALLGLLD